MLEETHSYIVHDSFQVILCIVMLREREIRKGITYCCDTFSLSIWRCHLPDICKCYNYLLCQMWRPLRITRCRIDNLKHNKNVFSYINKKIIVNNLLWIRKDILRDENNIWIIMITFYSDVWYVMKSDILKQIYFISEFKSLLSSTTHNRSIQNVHKYMYFSSFRNRNWGLLKVLTKKIKN